MACSRLDSTAWRSGLRRCGCWSPLPGLNWRPRPYQGRALPTELRGPFVSPRWSGKRDSNPRHSAWKADALPTELFPRSVAPRSIDSLVEGGGFEPPKAYAGRFTVCSLWPLGNPSGSMVSFVSKHLSQRGAGGGIRTRDLLLTRQLLYRLSYASETLVKTGKSRRKSSPTPIDTSALGIRAGAASCRRPRALSRASFAFGFAPSGPAPPTPTRAPLTRRFIERDGRRRGGVEATHLPRHGDAGRVVAASAGRAAGSPPPRRRGPGRSGRSGRARRASGRRRARSPPTRPRPP